MFETGGGGVLAADLFGTGDGSGGFFGCPEHERELALLQIERVAAGRAALGDDDSIGRLGVESSRDGETAPRNRWRLATVEVLAHFEIESDFFAQALLRCATFGPACCLPAA